MYCPNCGKPIPDGSKFCKECGANIMETVVTKPKIQISAPTPVMEKGKIPCPKCGKTISENTIKCPFCGFPVKAYSEAFAGQKEDSEIKSKEEPLENSSLSIAAIILSLTITILGFIFALIDLIQNDPTKKHTLSIIAICISVISTIVLIAMWPVLKNIFT